MTGREKLVSVGVPVRDGAPELEAALASVRGQSYENLEILVSDNRSSDDTAAICARHAEADPRIRVHRQPQQLTAGDNFRFVAERARGEYFMWAAHDDTHSRNYVAGLLAALERQPDAVAAFGAVADFGPGESPATATVRAYPVATRGLGHRERITRAMMAGGVEIYGLIRTSVLRGYSWPEADFAWDGILATYLACSGEIVEVPEVRFNQYVPARAPTPAERARVADFRRLRRARFARAMWTATGEARAAARRRGEDRRRLADFLRTYPRLRLAKAAAELFAASPPRIQELLRRLGRRRGGALRA